MNNNESVLNNLLGNRSSQTIENPNEVPTGTEDEVLITAARVVSIRYKVYIALILLLIVIVSCSFITPLIDNITAKNHEIDGIKEQIAALEDKEMEYKRNRELVDQIAELDSNIITCVNEGEGCKDLPEILQNNDNFSVARSYVLLGDMEDDKMEINEKRIIQNIDSFLLKNFGDVDTSELDKSSNVNDINEEEKLNSDDNLQENADNENSDNEDSETQDVSVLKDLGEKNGTINKILIGDKQKFNESLYYVPIELSITFEDKDGLLSFINNVEKRIPEEKDMRLLYKISKIAYDVVNYEQEQETIINMYLYYYEK